ncbi:hypothetical protein KKG51_00065 [Patescibacteria group bacterium]|nr:hypothetical protein [Patescibacteria group bacterium]
MSENNAENHNRPSGSSVVKTAIFAILAAVVVFGTFALENNVSALRSSAEEKEAVTISVDGRNAVEVKSDGSEFWDRFSRKYEVKPFDTVKTNDSEIVVINFPDGAVARLDGETEVVVDSGMIELTSGHLWLNSLYFSSDLEVRVGGVRISPFNSVLSVNFDSEKVEIYAHKNHVVVSFYQGENFLNTLLVTEGKKIDVNLSKLQEKLSKVLYSKLVKEFLYGTFPEGSLTENPWYAENISRDKQYAERMSSSKLESLRKKPLYNISLDSVGYKLKTFTNSLNSWLVFDDARGGERVLSFFLRQLSDAEHFYAYYSYDEAKERLKFFEDLVSSYDFTGKAETKASLYEALLKEFKELSFVDPNSELFDLREYVRALYLDLSTSEATDVSDRFYMIRTYLNDAYMVYESDPNLARSLVDRHQRRMKAAVLSYNSELQNIKNILVDENQIFDDLLLKTDALYKDKYFVYKGYLEEQWLNLIDDEGAKKEEKRLMISKKIMFLKQVRDYFLAEEISLDDTKNVLFRLFEEIEDYRVDLPATGIDELFTDNLSDLSLFWDFLSEPEYSVSLTHGTTRQARYDAYLGVQKGDSGLENLRRKILGEETVIEQGSVYDAEREVVDAFSAINVENIKLGDVKSYSQRFIDVYGAVSGLKFSCTYDREERFLTEVVLDDEFLTTGVRLEKFETLVKSYNNKSGEGPYGEQEVYTANPSEIVAETQDEKLARLLLVKKHTGFGFDVEKEDVQIVDLDAGLFRISDIAVFEDREVSYIYELDSASDIVLKLSVALPDSIKEVDGEISLRNLLKFVDEASIIVEAEEAEEELLEDQEK